LVDHLALAFLLVALTPVGRERVDLVDEDETGLVRPRFLEHRLDVLCVLTDPLADEIACLRLDVVDL
jgi:hypothetical protein